MSVKPMATSKIRGTVNKTKTNSAREREDMGTHRWISWKERMSTEER